MIQQLTEKLFAIEVTEQSKLYLDLIQGEKLKGLDWEFTYLGSVSKDTIDFDVEPFIEETDNPYHFGRGFKWIDYSNDINCFRTEEKEAAFRSLLTSKGCNPDEKHLIIEKI